MRPERLSDGAEIHDDRRFHLSESKTEQTKAEEGSFEAGFSGRGHRQRRPLHHAWPFRRRHQPRRKRCPN